MNSPGRLVLYAPGVHTGGGLVLLKDLLAAETTKPDVMFLDARSLGKLGGQPKCEQHVVKRSVFSRVLNELLLWRLARDGDTVFCFHGLPPFFRPRGRVIVFIQNRLLVQQSFPFRQYRTMTTLRLILERSWLKLRSKTATKFVVQSASMDFDTKQRLGAHITVEIRPFRSALKTQSATHELSYDFVYVASDDPHKNHHNLLAAWKLLAESGLKPSLAITLPFATRIAQEVVRDSRDFGLNISNIGKVEHADVAALYASAKALIYPSFVESFGLPLIEAADAGLPILAGELDFIRDVVKPAETFDPFSPLSIARAVSRFLGVPESRPPVASPDDFLHDVLK
jgi:glycosyltransferase involved in cell wall biosynthesis